LHASAPPVTGFGWRGSVEAEAAADDLVCRSVRVAAFEAGDESADGDPAGFGWRLGGLGCRL
jgi:hypothetical protein